jgi:integrating conjugative element membrane protein (TIGR03747 family)
MATPVQHAAQQQRQRTTLFSALLGLPWKVLGLLLVSLLFSVLLEYAGLLLFWPEQGWRHSQAMLHTELGWLGEHFRQSLITSQPGQSVRQLVESLHEWLFQRSGLLDYARQARSHSRNDSLTSLIAQFYVLLEDFVLAALFTSLTFVVRVCILVLATPLFTLAMLTGLVDGLMRRDLRKFGAGRESSFVYHRAKSLVVPLLVAPWMLYLTLPISLNPLWILLPSAAMQGTAVAITAATFKKYL